MGLNYSAFWTIFPDQLSQGRISRIQTNVVMSKHLIQCSFEIKYPNQGSYQYFVVNSDHNFSKSFQSYSIYFMLPFIILSYNWKFKQSIRFICFIIIIRSQKIISQTNHSIHFSGTVSKINHFPSSIMTILIGFSSVFGTSTSYAEKLQTQFDKNNIQSLCHQIDAYGDQWITNYKGILILLLSTTGNGECPPNANKFYKALKQCQQNKISLQSIKFVILGFGSTVYSNFCGFAKQVQSLLINCGAKQIRKIEFCDSNLKANELIKNEKLTKDIFNKWKKNIICQINLINKKQKNEETINLQLFPTIQKLVQTKRLKKMDENLAAKMKIINSIEDYTKLATAKVVEIKQLRQKTHQQTGESQRSTLHIKLKKNSDIKLTPGCVVNIYPENTSKTLKIQSHLNQTQNSNLIRQIIKRVKLNQPATRELINLVFNEQENFTHLTKQQKLLKYKQCLINKNLTVQNLINEFKPKNLNFYSKLQLEPPRSYSLCSWINNQQTIELCVSILPNGVTSQFFKSNPQEVKYSVLSSAFKTPVLNEPIMMVCNGTGIAPFRSIAQYYAEKRTLHNETSLKLFYGIQNQNTDFYFKQEWLNYQKKGLMEMKLAESRKNPEEKEYVQNILNENQVYEHLMIQKGSIYICGGSGMAQGVKKAILESIKRDTKNQEQINSLYQDLKMNSSIIEEIFH